MKDVVAQILNLQNRDIALLSVLRKIKAVPADVSAFESEIKKAQAELDSFKSGLSALEASRAEMRAERRAIEAKAEKYSGQLLGMKKREDYDALEAEIAKLRAAAGAIEEKELGILFEIDERRETLSKLETDTEIAIVKLKGDIASAQASLASLDAERVSAEDAFESARKEVSRPEWVDAYMRLKAAGKPLPLVVRLDKGQCGGCFLKVSADTADRVVSSGEPVFCEHCGKILYIDA